MSFYNVVKYLRDELQSNEDVHTVMYSVRTEADLMKKNIYPLAIINPTSANLNLGPVNEFIFDIFVVDQRDLSNDDIVDKFWGNDNQIDTMNMAHGVLNTLVTTLRNIPNDDGIVLIDATTLTPIVYSDKNILDGWQLTLTIQIPNTKIDVCKPDNDSITPID